MPTVIIKKIQIRGFGHRTLIVGSEVPSFWEIIFLFRWFRKPKPVAFIGKGSKWFLYPGTKPVPKLLARQLEKREKQFLIYNH